jgi:quinol monooxygenase YgiN
MPLHIFARIEPLPGKRDELFTELTLVLEPTRAETGCIEIHLYETTSEPTAFFIHSEWTDTGTFEAHADEPHTLRLIHAVDRLATLPLQAARTLEIA